MVKPRLRPGTRVLEIGAGKGAWTKAVLENFPHRTLYVVERLPLEGMIRQRCPSAGRRLRFHRTTTNDDSIFEDHYFDFAFSFGVFVHLPLREIDVIRTRLRPKMRHGGEVILQYSNWDKLDQWDWERAEVPIWFRSHPPDDEAPEHGRRVPHRESRPRLLRHLLNPAVDGTLTRIFDRFEARLQILARPGVAGRTGR